VEFEKQAIPAKTLIARTFPWGGDATVPRVMADTHRGSPLCWSLRPCPPSVAWTQQFCRYGPVLGRGGCSTGDLAAG